MEDLSKLEFIFDNYILGFCFTFAFLIVANINFIVPETRNSFARFLEKDKNSNLLTYYERVTAFLNRLRSIKDLITATDNSSNNNVSSQGSSSSTPNTPSSNISHNSNQNNHARPNSKTRISISQPSSRSTTPAFEMYYEVEILLHDFLETNAKYFIPYFETSRSNLALAIRERKAKLNEEVDTELEDAIFYAKAFQDFTKSVYSKLKNDIFPVYIRSEAIESFFSTYKNQERTVLLNKVAKKQGVELEKILFTEKEFTEDYIREKDFLFAFQLIHDQSSFWTPVFQVNESDESRTSVFYSTLNFITEKQKGSSTDGLLMLKYMGYLPFNIEDCAKIFYNGGYNNYDPSVRRSEFLELHLPDKEEEAEKEFLQRQVASAITYSELTLGSFLTKRDILVSNAVRYLPHLEEYVLVTKSVIHEQKPEKIKKHIRAKVFVGVSFEKIASNETRFTIVTYSQLGGWLKKLGKGMLKIAKQRSKFYVESFCRVITEGKKEQRDKHDYLNESVDKTFGYPKVIQWHEENIDRKELKNQYKGFLNKNLFDLKTKKQPSKQITVRL